MMLRRKPWSPLVSLLVFPHLGGGKRVTVRL